MRYGGRTSEPRSGILGFFRFGREPNFGRVLRRKILDLFGRKPIWSKTEAVENRGLTVYYFQINSLNDIDYLLNC